MRCLAGHELADDAAAIARLRGLYDTLDRSTTPLSVLLPWLPSSSMLSKVWASKQVYDIIDGAIRARVAGGVAHDDTLQMLLDHGDEKLVVVGVSPIRLRPSIQSPHPLLNSLSWGFSSPARARQGPQVAYPENPPRTAHADPHLYVQPHGS